MSEFKEVYDLCDKLYEEAYRVFMDSDTSEEFFKNFEAFNMEISQIAAQKFKPSATFSLFLMHDALLNTLRHNLGAPYYTFRKLFLERLQHNMQKTRHIGDSVSRDLARHNMEASS